MASSSSHQNIVGATAPIRQITEEVIQNYNIYEKDIKPHSHAPPNFSGISPGSIVTVGSSRWCPKFSYNVGDTLEETMQNREEAKTNALAHREDALSRQIATQQQHTRELVGVMRATASAFGLLATAILLFVMAFGLGKSPPPTSTTSSFFNFFFFF
jgi:hypothetical protein